MRHRDDVVDLREIANALRREVRWLIAGGLLGLLLGAGLSMLLPPRYKSVATVLLRAGSPGGVGALAGLGEGSMAALALGGSSGMLSLDNGFDTEVEILSSRSVIGAVVDSLGLQAEVTEPRGWSAAALFSTISIPADIASARYHFRREGTAYRVSGPNASQRVAPGHALRMDGVAMTLRTGRLPEEFVVRVRGRADAVDATRKRLVVGKAGGSMAGISFSASDPVTAAAVPNAVLAQYFMRRRTTDRGVNQQRYEFLREHTDSIERELARASQALREHQQQSGVLSPKIQNEVEVEQAMRLRARAQELEVEARALENVMGKGSRGHLDAREIAAYPTLLSNPAINQLLALLSELESKRTELLGRRTSEDPDVLLVEREIGDVEGQIIAIARSFHAGIARQLAEVRSELGVSRVQLSALPVEVEKSFRLEREVERLAQTLTALQTQLVQARLGAITEGGDVRPVDVAEAPKHPAFPTPPFLIALGLMGGLFFGGVGAVARGVFRSGVGDEHQAERLAGVPAVRFTAEQPLLVGGLEGARSVLVLPAQTGTSALEVAQRIAATAALRGEDVVLAELEPVAATAALPASVAAAGERDDARRAVDEPGRGGYRVVRGAEAGRGVRAVLEELEQQHGLVVAALPTLEHPATAAVLSPARPAVLVVRARHTQREALEGAVRALERLRIPLLGVVVRNGKHSAE